MKSTPMLVCTPLMRLACQNDGPKLPVSMLATPNEETSSTFRGLMTQNYPYLAGCEDGRSKFVSIKALGRCC